MEHVNGSRAMALVICTLFALISTVQPSTYSGTSETKGENKVTNIISGPKYLPNDVQSEDSVENDALDSLKDDDEKRRIDRMMFHSSLGKRDVGFDEQEVDKRGRIDSYGFSGMLGKRGGFDRYGFVGNLGKRRGFDRYGFVGNLGKRRGFDRYGLVGALGKRGRMDRYSFIGALGKRAKIDSYGFSGMLGKRDLEDDKGEMDAEKRAHLDRYAFFGKFGKRMDYDGDDMDRELEKRSVDSKQSQKLNTRRKRATLFPWFLDRRQRYYPSRWLRGIDRFSFGARLGKRLPNYRFFPQLGKRDDMTTYYTDDDLPRWNEDL